MGILMGLWRKMICECRVNAFDGEHDKGDDFDE